MSGKNSKKIIEEIFDGAVCAEECTGLLQKIEPSPEELKKFHKEYTED